MTAEPSANAEPAAALPAELPPPPRVLNLANVLTVLRVVLVPVFVVVVLTSGMTRPGWRMAACAIYLVAALTDYVDGRIARGWNLVTSFGKVADPIADKALAGSALLLLSGYGRLMWWVTIVILARELGVTLLRLWALRYGVIAASRGGKLKTALQNAGISWLLWPFPVALTVVGTVIIVAAAVVTVATGADYLVRAARLHRAAT
jgi:CDP-diacylglycerol---glycerol-3-phosphate 3-phosphatidyltransferase